MALGKHIIAQSFSNTLFCICQYEFIILYIVLLVLVSVIMLLIKKYLNTTIRHHIFKRTTRLFTTNINNNNKIDKINASEINLLKEHYFEKQEPVIIENGIQHWPAIKKWNDIEWMKETYGNHIVPVEVGKNYVDSEQHEIPLGAYLDYVMKKDTKLDHGELPTLYLAQYDLLNQIQELNDDVISPFSHQDTNKFNIGKIGKGDLYSTNMWISGANTTSNTHRDPLNNIFCQVVGRKYFRIFSPENEEDMYPNHSVFNSNTSRVEKVDCSQKEFDSAGFPNFYNVKYKEYILQSGDMLFLPKYQWHYATSETISVSVNYWFL